MPWKECAVLDQRTEFALKSMSRGVVFRDLCREFGISPKTGYKWKERFLQQGIAGLHDHSRKPCSSPESLPEESVCEMVRFKTAHPHWGPHKIRQLYLRCHGQAPSLSSFKRVLDRAGLVVHRRRRKLSLPQERVVSELAVSKPNDVWSVDFKGWWRSADGQRCEPLTVRDVHSKFILTITAMSSTRTQSVKPIFEQLFRRYGLPRVILSDNGPPFAVAHALLGLSSLSVWWIATGIRLHRIAPGHPEQNGSHERMHRDIRTELQGYMEAQDIRLAQARFDAWAKEYNWVRPHEALSMKVPGEVYTKSQRRWSGSPQVLQYDPSFICRKVSPAGVIKVAGTSFEISKALRGWDVGLKYSADSRMEVWFDYLRLGEIDLHTQAFMPAAKDG